MFKNTFAKNEFAKEICSKQISCFFMKKCKNANLRRISDTEKCGITPFWTNKLRVSLVKRMVFEGEPQFREGKSNICVQKTSKNQVLK